MILHCVKKSLREEGKTKVAWLIALFGIYAVMLVWLVLFKLHFAIPLPRPRQINLVPFYDPNAPGVFPVWDVLLNILAFVPLGLYLSMLRVPAKWAIPIGAAASLGFELTQLIFAIGVSDLTDLITNTAGTAAGVGIYLLLVRLCKDRPRLDRILLVPATAATALALLYAAVMLAAELCL